jgi:hypothetical protein
MNTGIDIGGQALAYGWVISMKHQANDSKLSIDLSASHSSTAEAVDLEKSDHAWIAEKVQGLAKRLKPAPDSCGSLATSIHNLGLGQSYGYADL